LNGGTTKKKEPRDQGFKEGHGGEGTFFVRKNIFGDKSPTGERNVRGEGPPGRNCAEGELFWRRKRKTQRGKFSGTKKGSEGK